MPEDDVNGDGNFEIPRKVTNPTTYRPPSAIINPLPKQSTKFKKRDHNDILIEDDGLDVLSRRGKGGVAGMVKDVIQDGEIERRRRDCGFWWRKEAVDKVKIRLEREEAKMREIEKQKRMRRDRIRHQPAFIPTTFSNHKRSTNNHLEQAEDESSSELDDEGNNEDEYDIVIEMDEDTFREMLVSSNFDDQGEEISAKNVDKRKLGNFISKKTSSLGNDPTIPLSIDIQLPDSEFVEEEKRRDEERRRERIRRWRKEKLELINRRNHHLKGGVISWNPISETKPPNSGVNILHNGSNDGVEDQSSSSSVVGVCEVQSHRKRSPSVIISSPSTPSEQLSKIKKLKDREELLNAIKRKTIQKLDEKEENSRSSKKVSKNVSSVSFGRSKPKTKESPNSSNQENQSLQATNIIIKRGSQLMNDRIKSKRRGPGYYDPSKGDGISSRFTKQPSAIIFPKKPTSHSSSNSRYSNLIQRRDKEEGGEIDEYKESIRRGEEEEERRLKKVKGGSFVRPDWILSKKQEECLKMNDQRKRGETAGLDQLGLDHEIINTKELSTNRRVKGGGAFYEKQTEERDLELKRRPLLSKIVVRERRVEEEGSHRPHLENVVKDWDKRRIKGGEIIKMGVEEHITPIMEEKRKREQMEEVFNFFFLF